MVGKLMRQRCEIRISMVYQEDARIVEKWSKKESPEIRSRQRKSQDIVCRGSCCEIG